MDCCVACRSNAAIVTCVLTWGKSMCVLSEITIDCLASGWSTYRQECATALSMAVCGRRFSHHPYPVHTSAWYDQARAPYGFLGARNPPPPFSLKCRILLHILTFFPGPPPPLEGHRHTRLMIMIARTFFGCNSLVTVNDCTLKKVESKNVQSGPSQLLKVQFIVCAVVE